MRGGFSDAEGADGEVVTVVTARGSTPPRSASLLLFASLTQTLVRVLLMPLRELREEEMRERVRTRCVA